MSKPTDPYDSCLALSRKMPRPIDGEKRGFSCDLVGRKVRLFANGPSGRQDFDDCMGEWELVASSFGFEIEMRYGPIGVASDEWCEKNRATLESVASMNRPDDLPKG